MGFCEKTHAVSVVVSGFSSALGFLRFAPLPFRGIVLLLSREKGRCLGFTGYNRFVTVDKRRVRIIQKTCYISRDLVNGPDNDTIVDFVSFAVPYMEHWHIVGGNASVNNHLW